MRIESEIGPHLEQQAKKNLKKGLPIVLVSYCFVLFIGTMYSPVYIDLSILSAPVYFILGIMFMYGLMQFMVPYKYFKMGSNGERHVIANISGKLGNEHSLFNDVMLRDRKSGGNIDHIIVGPRGIFVIETKNLSKDTIIYSDSWKGLRQSPSDQAKKNAKRLYWLLNSQNLFDKKLPLVHAIVVLTNPKAKIEVKNPPDMCKVVQLKNKEDTALYDYIMSYQEVILSNEEIGRIVQFLKDSKL